MDIILGGALALVLIVFVAVYIIKNETKDDE